MGCPMRVERMWIGGRLPDLNELLTMRAAPPVTRRRRDGRVVKLQNPAYHEAKANWARTIALLVAHARIQPWPEGAHFRYEWREQNRRRDPLNFAAGGQKFIEDALVQCGVLPNDGWKHVLSFAHVWSVGATPGVMVVMSDQPLVAEAMAG